MGAYWWEAQKCPSTLQMVLWASVTGDRSGLSFAWLLLISTDLKVILFLQTCWDQCQCGVCKHDKELQVSVRVDTGQLLILLICSMDLTSFAYLLLEKLSTSYVFIKHFPFTVILVRIFCAGKLKTTEKLTLQVFNITPHRYLLLKCFYHQFNYL